MKVQNLKSRSVMEHDFAMNSRTDVPRSVFGMPHGHKTAFSFSKLIPILVEEVLPGDLWRCGITVAARTATPIVPVMDNWHLEFFSFFVPMRLTWTNSARFWGEQNNPGDSISFTIPQVVSAAGGFPVNSLYDYMGLPTVGQVGGGNVVGANVLPMRAYMLICDQWFRDENLQSSLKPLLGDGPDPVTDYVIFNRGKRFDYFTQALPWPQKGNTAVTFPLGTSAPVIGNGGTLGLRDSGGTVRNMGHTSGSANVITTTTPGVTGNYTWATNPLASGLIADLSTATSATVNQLRQAITLQQYLEKDARGGTRYTEYVFNHFGVRSADARLQRPEFIGGGHAPILTNAIPQTSATGLTGGTTPAGSLAATGYVQGGTGFTYAATEHGFILTLVSARAELTYQQGKRKMWSRQTRYDYPVPLLANLGEQAMLNSEIYCDGSANDNNVFGYVPRWDEYRHIPSKITGLYRSTSAGTLDYWHSSQRFASLPTLNNTFIQDDSATTLRRNFAAGAAADNQQILADFHFDCTVTRALPAYGNPGLTRF